MTLIGYPVARHVEAVPGEGPWAPDPGKWDQGTGRGRF